MRLTAVCWNPLRSSMLFALMTRPFNHERKKRAPLNWRRGLFRLWVLISVAWIMGWLISFAIEFIEGTWTNRDFLAMAVILFGPPIALLLVAVATIWAFRGFET